MRLEDIDQLDFAKQGGLIPVIVQDAKNLRVLMLGYMNREAIIRTLETKHLTFFSRSKNRLWMKGETSGHVLHLQSICFDCDQDALLATAIAQGPTCHLGTVSCFTQVDTTETSQNNFVHDLDLLVKSRFEQRPLNSYTTQLFDAGITRIAQKVGEEGVETALAGVVQDDEKLLAEAADLVFHLVVLLRARGLSFEEVDAVLRSRHSDQNK